MRLTAFQAISYCRRKQPNSILACAFIFYTARITQMLLPGVPADLLAH